MPHKFQQNETMANTTRQKGLRNKRRTGRSTYSIKGKGKHAERYTRPYLTGEYLTWASQGGTIPARFTPEQSISRSETGEPKRTTHRANRPRNGINSTGRHQ